MNTTIISFVSLVVGAVLQFLFTRYLDDKKHQRDLRAKAYSDYMQCVSEFAILGRRKDSQEGRQLGARLADAKCRISLYGGPSVIAALAAFERLGPTLHTMEQRSAFIDVVSSMRKDVQGRLPVGQADLEVVLLGVHQ